MARPTCEALLHSFVWHVCNRVLAFPGPFPVVPALKVDNLRNQDRLSCCRWDMTGKPTAPMQTFAHGAAVTKVLHVRENVLALAGADGNITLWDPRSAARPIRTISLSSGCETWSICASSSCNSLPVLIVHS